MFIFMCFCFFLQLYFFFFPKKKIIFPGVSQCTSSFCTKIVKTSLKHQISRPVSHLPSLPTRWALIIFHNHCHQHLVVGLNMGVFVAVCIKCENHGLIGIIGAAHLVGDVNHRPAQNSTVRALFGTPSVLDLNNAAMNNLNDVSCHRRLDKRPAILSAGDAQWSYRDTSVHCILHLPRLVDLFGGT